MTTLRILQAVAALAGVLFAATAGMAQQQPVWLGFGSGVEVRLPPAYWGRLNPESKRLAVLSEDGDGVQFTLEQKAAGSTSRRSGKTAVRELAKTKGLKLHKSGDKLVLMEPRTERTLDGRESRNMQIHVGFDRFVVVMSLNVFEDKKDSPAVQQFFETDMEQIIGSMRRKKGG